jgi:putative peptide zinc metalloprotease protein
MTFTHSSCLSLVQIKIRNDKKHYIVEDKDSGEFYEMPKVCIDALRLINDGRQLGEIERYLKGKYPEEEVDLLDFAEQLLELKLIDEIDDIKVQNKQEKKEKLGFLWISPKIGKFFFNKFTFLVYIALFVINVVLPLSHPALFPHYRDMFIFDFIVLNIPTWMVLSVALVLIHEFGHVLAMRANNLPTKLGIGHRLFLVVIETDLASVWKLPSKDRNVLYLAGICFDTVILSFALMSQLIFVNSSVIFLSIMQVIVLDTFIRIIYQCCVYMKTDLYYVIENVSGCYNLMENAQQAIRKWLPFQKSSLNDGVVFESERRTVSLYSIFYYIGLFITITLYVVFYIPQLLFAWKSVLPGFKKAPTSLAFWDATLFSAQIMIVLLLLLYSWRKNYLKR